MGGEQSLQQEQARIDARDEQMHQQFDSQMALLAQHDQRTKLPHLLVELRNLGFIEVCGKDTGGIFERLRGFFQSPPWNGQAVSQCLKPVAAMECGCCVKEGSQLQEKSLGSSLRYEFHDWKSVRKRKRYPEWSI
jgi:hypothetical protein